MNRKKAKWIYLYCRSFIMDDNKYDMITWRCQELSSSLEIWGLGINLLRFFSHVTSVICYKLMKCFARHLWDLYLPLTSDFTVISYRWMKCFERHLWRTGCSIIENLQEFWNMERKMNNKTRNKLRNIPFSTSHRGTNPNKGGGGDCYLSFSGDQLLYTIIPLYLYIKLFFNTFCFMVSYHSLKKLSCWGKRFTLRRVWD
jgi:hypothetical protein